MVQDILYNATDGWHIGKSDLIHAQDIINQNCGDNKFAPTLGVGIEKVINQQEVDVSGLIASATEQLSSDGFSISSPITFVDDTLQISGEY